MDWRETAVAVNGTHHLAGGRALYDARFDQVLKFHSPGLAPAQDASGAFHIDVKGQAVYAERYRRTFGFYEDLAAVDDDGEWFHIHHTGVPAYADRFAWCGNYQGQRCAVRLDDGRYLHLDLQGKPVYEQRWAYAGDFRDGVAVVQGDDGLSTHVDNQGEQLHGRWFHDLDVFHKGFARARDDRGWMHVGPTGKPVYERRFASVEPFYNGQARVERFDGALEVMDESGRPTREIRPPRQTALQRLSGDMVGFWRTQTIRAAVELNVFDALPGDTAAVGSACSLESHAMQRLLRALWELDLVEPRGGLWTTTDTGRLLCHSEGSGMPEAALHWATEHYRAWEGLPEALKTGRSAFHEQFGDDLFSWLAERPAKMRRFQAAMLAYAEHDYRDIPRFIDFDGVEEVVDAGGGTGVLLTKLLEAQPAVTGTLLELDTVTSSVRAPAHLAERFRIHGADLLQPWPCSGDLVVLARVLHDWADEPAARILTNAHHALRPGGRVLLVEWVLSDESPNGGMLDLNMAALCGSRERTLQDWTGLGTAAGLRLTEVQSLPSYGSLIELQP